MAKSKGKKTAAAERRVRAAAPAMKQGRFRWPRVDKGTHRTSQLWGRDQGQVDGAAARVRVKWVKCGKENCRACPHGPFRYLVWREGGKMRERYLGKGWPED